MKIDVAHTAFSSRLPGQVDLHFVVVHADGTSFRTHNPGELILVYARYRFAVQGAHEITMREYPIRCVRRVVDDEVEVAEEGVVHHDSIDAERLGRTPRIREQRRIDL